MDAFPGTMNLTPNIYLDIRYDRVKLLSLQLIITVLTITFILIITN